MGFPIESHARSNDSRNDSHCYVHTAMIEESLTLKLSVMRSNFNSNSVASVESAIDSIAAILATSSPTGCIVKREPAVKGKCCKGIISVTISPKYTEENGGPCELQSMVKYAFYASTTHPTQLGSVAIYAADLGKILSDIRRTRSLFGFRVANVAIEHGRRPFMDVTLAIKG